MDIFVLILASGMALYSNEQACEHDAWMIESVSKGYAQYGIKRCHDATGSIGNNIVSYSVYKSGTVVSSHSNISSCNSFISQTNEHQFYKGDPISAWCSYVDRPVQVEVQK